MKAIRVAMVAALAGASVLAVVPPASAEPLRRGVVLNMHQCAEEDGSGSPLPCRWDASRRGHGKGKGKGVSFIVRPVGAPRRGVQRVAYVYDDGHVVRGTLPAEECETVTTEPEGYSFCDG